MSFEKLKTLVGDSAESLGIIKTLEETASNNVKTINDLERRVTEVSDTRDKYKMGNSTVKSLLGLEAINEDTLKEFLENNKGKGGDEKLVAEITNLKDLLQTSNTANDTLTNDFNGQIQAMGLDNAFTNAKVSTIFANDDMLQMGMGLFKKGAAFKDNNVTYMNDDGSTAYGKDGKPLTIQGRVDEVRANPNYAGLFKPDVNSDGTNMNPSNNSTPSSNKSMSATEMMKAGRA